MNYFSLSVTALIPAVVLCIYIYSKDKAEKEPAGLLLLLFLAGGTAYLPSFFIEGFALKHIDGLFSDYMKTGLTGVEGFTSSLIQALHGASCGVIAIALTEEAIKWAVLILLTRRNKNFSHLFDGVIYSVFVSLGFAAAENIRYAVNDGWGTFLLRALTSVPAHMVFGVIMGFFYTLWNVYRIAAVSEKDMAEDGTISVTSPIRYKKWLALSFVFPVLVHGLYSFLRYFSTDIMQDAFYVILTAMYVLCLIAVNRLSADDSHEQTVARKIIMRKYPHLKEEEVEITPDDGEGDAENG